MDGLRNLPQTLVSGKLSLASALSILVSGLVLLSAGLNHGFNASEALLAQLLSMVNLTVAASPAFSLGGLLWLLSVLVGIMVGLTGLYLLYAFGQLVWGLLE